MIFQIEESHLKNNRHFGNFFAVPVTILWRSYMNIFITLDLTAQHELHYDS